MRFESYVFVDPMLLFSVTSYCIFGMMAVDLKPFLWIELSSNASRSKST